MKSLRILLPALLPSYLAYAGFNAVRGPGTPVGDWLALLAQEGHRWAPLVAGRGCDSSAKSTLTPSSG